ncbi:hypothetical protein Cgig2_030498 [Carnegiea gigantea]|uniref:NADH-plastoquinone oxidoreductase subunit 1 n=1 Tax=Carnegiea gigantea TaxID=171969 RepID=A0A9Q1GTL9_9CARY|nr:hypothetical protein Cgig2_030498 [Carnegiea gigantea]
MIIDTIEVQALKSFPILESLKEVYETMWMFIPILILILGITIGVVVIVGLEREISMGMEQRIGPEYASPLGILQALANRIKLLVKENLLPSRGDTRLFGMGPSIAGISILLSYSLRRSQNTVFGGGNFWQQPIGFIIFLISSLAKCKRLPFDLPEAEEELVASYQTEYSEFLHLHGWNLSIPYILIPKFLEISKVQRVFGTTIGIFITLAKTFLFLFIPITIKWTLARLRMDQLLNFG